mgnify:CR=1 FL=1
MERRFLPPTEVGGFRAGDAVMICCHGAAHNDTICIAETIKQPRLL